jgi:hypothetical protein
VLAAIVLAIGRSATPAEVDRFSQATNRSCLNGTSAARPLAALPGNNLSSVERASAYLPAASKQE